MGGAVPLQTTDNLLGKMGLEKELALEFFITFARFEYALIAAGYFRQRDNGTLEPDWNCFINCVSKLSPTNLKLVCDAGENLLKYPPKKLIIEGGSPKFVDTVRNGQSDIRFLLEGVKRARNNLFHGAKYYTATTPANRNEAVVTDSLNVLRKILDVEGIANVRTEFDREIQ
jgi:hypothetical protein